jgi:hypothetical protein
VGNIVGKPKGEKADKLSPISTFLARPWLKNGDIPLPLQRSRSRLSDTVLVDQAGPYSVRNYAWGSSDFGWESPSRGSSFNMGRRVPRCAMLSVLYSARLISGLRPSDSQPCVLGTKLRRLVSLAAPLARIRPAQLLTGLNSSPSGIKVLSCLSSESSFKPASQFSALRATSSWHHQRALDRGAEIRRGLAHAWNSAMTILDPVISWIDWPGPFARPMSAGCSNTNTEPSR